MYELPGDNATRTALYPSSATLCRAAFLLYLLVAGTAMWHHELWGDEIHSWNIAKESATYPDLIANTRYEGHPPVWYSLLWIVSRLTHDPAYMQVLQFVIAASVVYILLFHSPLPLVTKLLIPFGYYFLFEYGVMSRNYAIGILFAFSICIIIQKESLYKNPLYYALLLLMSNTHLLALLLAVSLHFYFLLNIWNKRRQARMLVPHLLAGIAVMLPALYFIFPPSDSGLNMDHWKNNWDVGQVGAAAKAPLRALLPIPAWWNHNFWNTHFFTEWQHRYVLLKPVSLLLSAALIVLLLIVLRKSKKSLILFAVNLLLNFAVAIIFPALAARYIGFIFIGFIVAYWLSCYERTPGKIDSWLVNALLVIQLGSAAFVVWRDIRLPFSNAGRVGELLAEVPAGEKIVTDYWCVNAISAFTDKKLYCLGLDRELSFLLWNEDLKKLDSLPYTNSLMKLFQQHRLNKVYLISMYQPAVIKQKDPALVHNFRLTLVDKREGAIEKWSNIYLYQLGKN